MRNPGDVPHEPRRPRRFPSPATVISCVALAIALSRSAYAVSALPRGSVGTPQLKADAVNGAKVRNRSLLRRDLAADATAGPRGAPGAQGPPGPQGPQG